MQGIDTNILIRALTEDDKEQSDIAKHVISNAKSIYISNIVLIESVWVLESCYQFSKKTIINIISQLLDNEAIVFNDKKLVSEALDSFKENNIDFSDSIILLENKYRKVSLITFDKKLSKVDGAQLAERISMPIS